MHVPTHLVAAMSRLIRMLCIAGTAALATPGAMAQDDSSPAGVVEYRPTVLITGSNRGIGYEFARQYAERGWFVIATSRSPEDDFELKELDEAFDNLIIEQLDVTDHARIDALAAQYAGTPIDVLLNNAGISGGGDNQLFGRLNYEPFDLVMQTNVVGPLKLAEAFVEHVAQSREKKIITVSSSQGSLNQVRVGMLYFYRASKAALNMVMVNLAKELKPRDIVVAMVAPGATDTDFMEGVKIPLGKPEDRVRGMIEVIDNLDIEKTGSFTEYSGEELPW